MKSNAISFSAVQTMLKIHGFLWSLKFISMLPASICQLSGLSKISLFASILHDPKNMQCSLVCLVPGALEGFLIQGISIRRMRFLGCNIHPVRFVVFCLNKIQHECHADFIWSVGRES